MAEGDVSLPAALAWLDVSTADEALSRGRSVHRTGPLGMQITPLPHTSAPYFFTGARLRGARCVWSASTVSGARLCRSPRSRAFEQGGQHVEVLARMEAGGSVFDPVGTSGGHWEVFDTADGIDEYVETNTHLFTVNVPLASLGIDPLALRQLHGRRSPLTPFQFQLLRAGVGLLTAGDDELRTRSSLIGVDNYVASLAALLLRTAEHHPGAEPAQAEMRARTDAIIAERVADPQLTPAAIAAQLGVSLRQLYRAFDGTDSPAARIRRRRLGRAAEILATRAGPGQVKRVANECGFVSAEYFSRAFRREFGLSPRAYSSSRPG